MNAVEPSWYNYDAPRSRRCRPKTAPSAGGPGVYLWKAADGTMLYVGKAKRLRSRVRSYFANDHLESVKTRHLGWPYRRPRDDRRAERSARADPRSESHQGVPAAVQHRAARRQVVSVHQGHGAGAVSAGLRDAPSRRTTARSYFGPYTDVGAMRRALNVVKRIFTVRSCNYDMPAQMPERPCLDYYIKRCKAPCILAQIAGRLSRDDRRSAAVSRRKTGRSHAARARADGRSRPSRSISSGRRSCAMRCIISSRWRSRPSCSKSKVATATSSATRATATTPASRCLRIRGGKLLAREHRFLENHRGEEDYRGALQSFSPAVTCRMQERATELLVPFDFEDRELLEAVARRNAASIVPQRGPRRELSISPQQNARHLLEELRLASHGSRGARRRSGLRARPRARTCRKLPRSLVCFDISTTQGTDTVGSCVWFENGRPSAANIASSR